MMSKSNVIARRALALPDEAISLAVLGIASGKGQERPRNDMF
jgi:hypothetical protein